MKPEEIKRAIEVLRDIDINYPPTQQDEADIEGTIELAIQALEKQVAVNPNGYDNGGAEDYEEWAECPKCSESIPEYTLENETECYCIGCGQKLKWEEIP